NFAIIAHIDHGKSTLADRFLEITKTIEKSKITEQFLDQNPISRKRGITIKLAPVKMEYQGYILNLIDTPGHMDFSYEVSRTLAACEGAIILVDATQGIQAQTMAHFNAARKENLFLIPAINKIDLPTAKAEEVARDIEEIFGFKKEDIFYVSAKTGEGVGELLKEVIKKIPPPQGNENLRALIFDAEYDEHRGVVAFVRVMDGEIKKRDKIQFFQTNVKAEALEIGIFCPFLTPREDLKMGEIGYIITGVKDIRLVRVGDTITSLELKAQAPRLKPLAGYEDPKPMVFFGVYPKEQKDLPLLKEALSKLSLNDASLSISTEYSEFLGTGFRVGFLGLLHAEIVKERLKEEEGIEPLLTLPRVLYKKAENEEILEPYMKLTIYTPVSFLGSIMTVCQKKKGSLINLEYHKNSAILHYDIPYSMFIRGLASDLKSVSSGFATLDYEISEYKKADLTLLEILINDTSVDVLSEFVYSDEVEYLAREKVGKLKEIIPRQQFRQVIQAKARGRIVARCEISPFRKDVLQKLYGGDRTRKDKLLEKQKKGKSKLFGKSKVYLPQEALLPLISKNLDSK
ncbi:translation elongation factor 4, partial [Patescibacteria group bacterium]|nr:translation elongation factor 4 [Patescibacteria group bacterium]